MSKPPPVSKWVSLTTAADFLGLSYDGFRKRIERAAKNGKETIIDDIRCRKVGASWRIQLGPWAEPPEMTHGELPNRRKG